MNNSENEITILNHEGQIITTKLEDEIRIINEEGYIINTKPNNETNVDLSTSCNKAVAIAILLGWLEGPIFQKVMVAIPNDDGDVYVDLLRILDEHESYLQEMLSHMRNVTNQILADAADSGAPYKELKRKKEAVANIDSLIQKASMYRLDIDEELSKGESSEIIIDQQTTEKTGTTHITLRSLDQWAKEMRHISFDIVAPPTNMDIPVGVTWEEIEIRIRKDNKIAYSHEKGKWTEKTFAEIGLLDKRTQHPNQSAGILIGLSIGEKFPSPGTVEGKHKTAMSKLGKLLCKLTGINSAPFTRSNGSDGWKPKFKLTDDRRNADNRAKKAALHEEYKHEINYDKEDDAAAEWLENNK